MSKVFSLYLLRDPRTNDVRYVGQTARPARERLRQHIGKARKNTTPPVNAWIRGLLNEGKEPIQQVVMTSTDPEWIDRLERKCIRGMRDREFNLLNRCNGGAHGRRWQRSEKELEELRNRLKVWREQNPDQNVGRKNSEETKQIMRERALKRWKNPDYAARVISTRKENNKDKVLSEADLKILSEAGKKGWAVREARGDFEKLKGVKQSQETKDKISATLKARFRAKRELVAGDVRRKEATINVEGYAGRRTLDPT